MSGVYVSLLCGGTEQDPRGILTGVLVIESQNKLSWKGAYKVIKSNPLLNAGIQLKADLTGGCPLFS